MLLRLLGIKKDVEEVHQDPAGFMVKKLGESIRGVLVVWGIFLFTPLIILGIYGLTDLWGGPYQWVRVAFFIYLGIWVLGVLIVRALVRLFIRKSRTAAEGVMGLVKERLQQRPDVHDQ